MSSAADALAGVGWSLAGEAREEGEGGTHGGRRGQQEERHRGDLHCGGERGAGGDTLALANQAEQQMLSADVVVAELTRLFKG